MNRKLVTLSVSIALGTLLVSPTWASDKKEQKLSATEISQARVVVPSSTEIFSALGKAGISKWTVSAGNLDVKPYTTRQQQAMNLGRITAQAAVSIQAKDKATLLKQMDAISALAERLNIKKSLLAMHEKMKKQVESNDWAGLQESLMELENATRNEIKDKNDLALANAAGWVTGMAIVANNLNTKYSAAGSKVLRQPALVDFLSAELAKLPATSRKGAVAAIADALPTIKGLVNVGKDSAIPQQNVQKLAEIGSKLVDAISK